MGGLEESHDPAAAATAADTPPAPFRRTGPVDVAVIIVTHQSELDIDDVIASLRPETKEQSIRVVIADNASTDATVSHARRHEDVVVVETGGNLGYAAAINRAMSEAGESESFLVLNPDLHVHRQCVSRLRQRLSNSRAGIVVPAILSPAGQRTQSLRREPSLTRSLGDALFGRRWVARPAWLSETVRSSSAYSAAHRIEWATGAAALISRQAVQRAGLWDESYFLYSEETDYFKSVRDLGLEVWYEPSAHVTHSEGGSGRSPELVALTVVNAVRYMEKHHPSVAKAHRVTLALHELRRWRDPSHRIARTILLDRKLWNQLPGGQRSIHRQNPPDSSPSTIDHVLITRFNLPSEGAERLIRAREGWLQDRVQLFERHTVPTVRAQTAKNFRWIVYFDTESPEWLISRLRPLIDSRLFFPIFREAVGWLDVREDAREVSGALGDILITTNLDNDDAIATDFVERLQGAAQPGIREAIFLSHGLIRSGGRVFLRVDRNNAFCSVAEPWDDAQTAWRDWHILLGKHMPTRVVGGQPAWLQVIHTRNVSNRVRGRLVSAERYAALFADQLDDMPRISRRAELMDYTVFGPLRETREAVRTVAKAVLLRALGKEGLGRLREQLRRLRSR